MVTYFNKIGKKNHRNGIFRPLTKRYPSLKGVTYFRYLLFFTIFNFVHKINQVDPKFLRNLKFSKKHNKRVAKPVAAAPKQVQAVPVAFTKAQKKLF